jgi:hypothetical protein
VAPGPWRARPLEADGQTRSNVTRVSVIFNPDTQPYAAFFNSAIEAAAPSMAIAVTLAPARDDMAIREAIAAQAREPGGGLVCLPDSFTFTHRDVIIAAAALHGLPLIGTDFPRAGGLMSYWYDAVELHAEAASYIDRIHPGRPAGTRTTGDAQTGNQPALQYRSSPDSPLEGNGFELPVPRPIGNGFEALSEMGTPC